MPEITHADKIAAVTWARKVADAGRHNDAAARKRLATWSTILADIERLPKLKAVASEIREIMATYREQLTKQGYVDTPGGLEHMGDVWRLLERWDEALAALDAPAGER